MGATRPAERPTLLLVPDVSNTRRRLAQGLGSQLRLRQRSGMSHEQATFSATTRSLCVLPVEVGKDCCDSSVVRGSCGQLELAEDVSDVRFDGGL